MPITPDFDHWIAGLPVLHMAREVDFDHWIAGLPVLQLEPSPLVPLPPGFVPPIIVND